MNAPADFKFCVCGQRVFGDATIHACCAKWWDGKRCLACEASDDYAHGVVWKSHNKATIAMRFDPKREVAHAR